MSNLKTVQRFQHFSFILFIFALLTSCSSNNTVKSITQQGSTKPNVTSEQTSADYLLSQAQLASSKEAIDLFIQASEQFIVENNRAKSLWLTTQTLPLTDVQSQRQQLLLIKAENLFELQEYDLAAQTLNSIVKHANGIDDNINLEQRLRYYHVLAKVQLARGLPLIAMDAKLRAFALNPNSTAQNVIELWQQLNDLSQWQIDQLVALSPPHIQGWQQLLNFAHRFGYQQTSFQRYLAQWQREYPQHPAHVILPSLKNSEIALVSAQQNIAIILPLSGKQKIAGESAQQGILASYNNNPDKNLFFIDSNQLDISTLASQLNELAIDFVIGPLLKPNVDAYIAQPDIEQPTLLLNLPEQQQLKAQHIVFSMDPKDEAIQAATTLSRQKFLHPIVFSQHDNVSQRIAHTFAEQWQKITGELPEIVLFDNEKNIQDQVKLSLGIEQSQARIDEIDKRIRQKLKVEPRNRRDLDMIYLVGSPSETRLLKPYIDVNISPFAQAIPIFASSRSHSDNADSSDSRDLTGLKFTEMPWLLTSKQQNKSLKALNETIWPDRNDSLQRIFAMGYDSLSLIDKFQAIKQTPYIRHFGQTGVLKLNHDGVLTRSLLWGIYQQDKVEEVAME